MKRLRSIVTAGLSVFMFGLFALTGSTTAVAEDSRADTVQLCSEVGQASQVACVIPGGTVEIQALGCADIGGIRGARFYGPTGASGTPNFTFCVPRKCTSSYDGEGPAFRIAYLSSIPHPSGNWNNRISSVRTYNSCDVKLYGLSSFDGASSTWIHYSANLGNIGTGWSNRASSLRLS